MAETDRKHLQERVNDLTKQVRTSEEKLSVYERRTGSTSVGGTVAVSSSDSEDAQQLRSELAELR